MPRLTMGRAAIASPWFNATRLLFPDENRVTRTVVSFARRLKIRRQGHKFRRRRRSPGRSVRDDNFTTKCTTAPGGTPYTSFRKLPSSRSRSTVVFGALPSLPPRLPSPFPPPRASPFLLISFFFDSQCMHARVREPSTMFTRRHVSKVNGPVISPFISSVLSSPISFTSAPI